MIDLDALERAFDQAEELPFVRMPTLRRVVAELRASRKVVEELRDIVDVAEAIPVGCGSFEHTNFIDSVRAARSLLNVEESGE